MKNNLLPGLLFFSAIVVVPAATSALTASLMGGTLYVGAPTQWIGQYFNYSNTSPSAWITSQPGGGSALKLATRTSDATGNWAPIGQTIFYEADGWAHLNPNPGDALYLQSDLWPSTANSAIHVQQESSINSDWPTVSVDPYTINPINETSNLRLDCGEGPTSVTGQAPNSCSDALEVISNGASYLGPAINIADGAVYTASHTQDGTAIGLPLWNEVTWFSAPGVHSASVKSEQPGELMLSVIPGGKIRFVVGGVTVACITSGGYSTSC